MHTAKPWSFSRLSVQILRKNRQSYGKNKRRETNDSISEQAVANMFKLRDDEDAIGRCRLRTQQRQIGRPDILHKVLAETAAHE